VALIVEDNTGRPDADSYLEVAAAAARLVALGFAAFPALATADAAKAEAFLRRSTIRVDEVVNAYPRGVPLNVDQALALPRSGLFIQGRLADGDVVPRLALDLCAIGAEVEALGLATASTPGTDSNIKRIRRASGAEVEFFAGAKLSEAQREASDTWSRMAVELRFDAPGGLPI